MNDFKIVLNLDSLARTKLGTVTAQVWISANGHEFPEQGWSDLPSGVLESIEEAVKALNTGASQATAEFLDGPFELDLIRVDSTTVAVIMKDQRSIGTPIRVETTTHAIAEELARVQRQLRAAKWERGWA